MSKFVRFMGVDLPGKATLVVRTFRCNCFWLFSHRISFSAISWIVLSILFMIHKYSVMILSLISSLFCPFFLFFFLCLSMHLLVIQVLVAPLLPLFVLRLVSHQTPCWRMLSSWLRESQSTWSPLFLTVTRFSVLQVITLTRRLNSTLTKVCAINMLSVFVVNVVQMVPPREDLALLVHACIHLWWQSPPRRRNEHILSTIWFHCPCSFDVFFRPNIIFQIYLLLSL